MIRRKIGKTITVWEVLHMLNRPQIKADARLLIRTAAVSPLIMSAIVLLIVFLLERVSDLAQYGDLFYTYTYNGAYLEALLSGNASALPTLVSSSSIPWFFSVLVSLFTTILYGGYYTYCLGIHRGVRMPYSTLLDGLSVSGKLIWCGIQMAVKATLWGLLFLVPGFIAVYRYRFAYYNILTDDSLSAGEAIRLSCQQTAGIKGDLFMLDLSFIGWSIVASLTFGLLNIWLIPYMTLSDLGYFEDASRRVSGF